MPNHCDDSYMYLNYYTAEVNDEIDNPPIGLILCTDKGNVVNSYFIRIRSSQNVNRFIEKIKEVFRLCEKFRYFFFYQS